MRLSADRINKKSPYWVIQLDELTFRFVTRNGIIYRVGFYKDQYFLGLRTVNYPLWFTVLYQFFRSYNNNFVSLSQIMTVSNNK